MKIAITGGTGVLGRHLVRELMEYGHEVVVLTRSDASSVGPGYQLVTTDYSVDELKTTFRGLDAVVHLAASRSASPLLREHLTSLELASDVFEASVGTVGHVVFASSISVYGPSTANPLPWRESSPIAASRPYGVLKYAAERLGAGMSADSEAPFTALRVGHLYGANEENQYMVNLFMSAARRGNALHLRSPSVVSRDFLYAGDAAVAFRLVLEARETGVFNVGSGSPATNEEMAHHIVEGFCSTSSVVIDDPDSVEKIAATSMDISAIRSRLGFTPREHLDAFKDIRNWPLGGTDS